MASEDSQKLVAENDNVDTNAGGDDAFDGLLHSILNEFKGEDEIERQNLDENRIGEHLNNQKQIWPSEDESEEETDIKLELEDRYSLSNVEEFNPDLEYEVDETENELIVGPGMLLSKESLEELERPSLCLITPEDVKKEEDETEWKKKIQQEICSTNKPIRELAELAMGHKQIEWITDDLDYSQMEMVMGPLEARRIAEEVVEDIETFFDGYFFCHKLIKKRALRRSASSDLSLVSNVSELMKQPVGPFVFDGPSTIDMYFEKGETDYSDKPLNKLPEELYTDAECQVHLHRSNNANKYKADFVEDNGTQTKLMTFVNNYDAERAYRHIYPLKDYYIPPPIPSRQASMEINLNIAKNTPEDIDKQKVGPKVKWSKKQRLLPPLIPRDYHKEETFWTGSKFTGRYEDRQFKHGFFNYPLMSTYESEFHKGQIHTNHHLGLVLYPRGDKFEGKWRRGRHLHGKITFCDGLPFKTKKWKYCTLEDRRFYIERDVGVKQVGRTLFNDRLPNPEIPAGMYDVGDGIYNPKKKTITMYETGIMLERHVDKLEHDWIIKNCRKSTDIDKRYNLSFDVNRLPCSYAEKIVEQ